MELTKELKKEISDANKIIKRVQKMFDNEWYKPITELRKETKNLDSISNFQENELILKNGAEYYWCFKIEEIQFNPIGGTIMVGSCITLNFDFKTVDDFKGLDDTVDEIRRLLGKGVTTELGGGNINVNGKHHIKSISDYISGVKNAETKLKVVFPRALEHLKGTIPEYSEMMKRKKIGKFKDFLDL